MAYTPTPTDIQSVRYEVQDIEVGLYILPDATYEYILTKNEGSISRSSIDAARMILMRLSITAKDQTIDILSIKSSKQAESYRQALILFIKDPSLNPLYNNINGWAGNVSVSEIKSNINNPDNNIPSLAVNPLQQNIYDPNQNPFTI